MELVTLKRYPTENEAQLVATFLEFNEIRCFIHNNISSTILPLFNTTFGGTELKVNGRDYEKAMALLKEFEKRED